MVVTPDDYLLFYSANAWDSERYAIGWATCESVSGPCRRSTADPWMDSTKFARGPGGQEFFGALGDVWMVYHGWEPGEIGYPQGERRLYLDIVEDRDGTPIRVGQETAWSVLGAFLVAGVALVVLVVVIRHRRRRRRVGAVIDP